MSSTREGYSRSHITGEQGRGRERTPLPLSACRGANHPPWRVFTKPAGVRAGGGAGTAPAAARWPCARLVGNVTAYAVMAPESLIRKADPANVTARRAGRARQCKRPCTSEVGPSSLVALAHG